MDIYPTKAQFLRGEETSLRLETCGAAVLKAVIRLSRLGETLRELRLHDVTADTNIPLGSFDESFSSYGVDARVETEGAALSCTRLSTLPTSLDDAYATASSATSRERTPETEPWIGSVNVT